jgi:tetratricopeptide (TPR) repeat protein
LAIAYAAAGRFDEAIATDQKAIELARADGQKQLVGEIEARLELFRSGHPYHRSAEAAAP